MRAPPRRTSPAANPPPRGRPAHGRPLRVLFVEHAHGPGGAMVSLVATVRALARVGVEATVALARPAPAVAAAYAAAGIAALPWPGIGTFAHLRGVPRPPWRVDAQAALARELCGWRRAEARTRALVGALRPDLVHLNSVTLAPSARALLAAGTPLVWHVREHPPAPHLGLRTALIARLLRACGAGAVFLSHADEDAWGMAGRGTVVPDFVDMADYTPGRGRAAARAAAGVAADAPVVAYLGGLAALKGIGPMLAALVRLRAQIPGIVCLAPGALPPAPVGRPLRLARAVLPRLGHGTQVQRAEATLRAQGLAAQVVRTPFVADVRPVLAAADVLAFPATEPHFARPVMEAAAMAVPSVVACLPGPRELVVHGETGLLVPAGDAAALAARLGHLLTDARLRRAMGRAARRRALRLYAADAAAQRLLALYARVRSAAPPGTPRSCAELGG